MKVQRTGMLSNDIITIDTLNGKGGGGGRLLPSKTIFVRLCFVKEFKKGIKVVEGLLVIQRGNIFFDIHNLSKG